MQEIFAARALLPTGWHGNVSLRIQDGRVADVTPGTSPAPTATRVDSLLPALSNLHSHTFQRAMAGMTEHRAAGRDSFWTWRKLMYQFLDHLSPKQVEAIAALAFMEMQEAGFAAVAEFHYVHNQPGGAPYDDIGELGNRILAAAQTTGIGLTHLPVLYTYGGAGKQPLQGGQLRFGNTVDSFAALLAESRAAATVMPADSVVGMAPHSLRATAPDELVHSLGLAAGNPIHMHIAEQPREVAEIKDWLGARPVEWLLDAAPVDRHWCLIHASHMTHDETGRMARSEAVAGLCPVTEANLGDGPFNGPDFLAAGGRFGVGTDSNVRISMIEELRQLEYAQRMRDLSRNVFIDGEGSVGTALYTGAAKGGAQALGRDAGAVAPGAWADLVAIDSTAPTLCALATDQLLDGLVFAADTKAITDVWSAGRHCVSGGRHVARDGIIENYRAAMTDLLGAL